MRKAARSDLVAILLLVTIAAFFRLYRLHDLPIGLWRDEAANGLEALRVLDGQHDIFFGTREPMFIYLVAVSVAFLGRNPFAIRLVAALVGTVTVPVIYLLVTELFGKTTHNARLLACLAGFWLATSYWHLNFSRLGFRGVLLPLFASLSFYLLWRGWNELQLEAPGGRLAFCWLASAGLCFGLTLYTYTPARFLPLILIPFFARALWAGNLPTRRPAASMALVVFVVCFLLVFAPLGKHFLEDPQSFFVRSGVSVFGGALDEPLLLALGKNTLRQLGMFGFLADPNIRHDPAGRPAFDLVTCAFFAAGLAASLRRWRQAPHQFCLVWFFVMLLPAILTYPELPHYLRAIGALPMAYVFPALGLESTWTWLRARHTPRRQQWAFCVVASLCLLAAAALTFRDYFAARVEEIELVKAFDPRFVEIADLMNDLAEPDSVWVIPVGPRDEQRMAYFVIDFLYEGETPHHYVHIDETTLAKELTASCQGMKRALVLQSTEVRLSQPWHDLYSDSRRLIPFLLDKHCWKVETLQYGSIDVPVYELPQSVEFSFPTDLHPTDVDFGESLTLTGQAYGLGSADPAQAWVALRWQVRSTGSADYSVTVAWTDGQGKTTATIDKPLLSTEMRPTSGWEPDQQEVDYYSVPGLPEPPPGDYSIRVSVCPMNLDRNSGFDAGSAESCGTQTPGNESSHGATLD